MSEWVRTDIDFGRPHAILTISDSDLRNIVGLDLPGLLNDPKILEKIIYDLIAELRPEWEGGVLFGIRYRIDILQWEFAYMNRSFEKLNKGAVAPYLPLIPKLIYRGGL